MEQVPARTATEVEGNDAARTPSTRQLKKRELDRKAQRLSRERTKTRIARLEELVESFKRRDSSGQLEDLIEQLQRATAERDAFASLLRSFKTSIDDNLAQVTQIQPKLMAARDSKSPSDRNHSSNDEEDGKSEVPSARMDRYPCVLERRPAEMHETQMLGPFSSYGTEQMFDLPVISEMSVPVGSQPSQPPASLVPSFYDAGTAAHHIGDPLVPAAMPGCDCYHESLPVIPKKNLNLWRFANEVLTPIPLPTEGPLADEDWRDDIPIRAMTEGWPAVEARFGGLPPLWDKLRQIDETMFARCDKVERLAILRTMHNYYLYRTAPSPSRQAHVPTWQYERPSQALAHSFAIDFFAWPGLRERFVFSQHRYCGNTFWNLFASSIKIIWDYEFRDCYSFNVGLGQYKFSDLFEKRITDINVWTMQNDIFERWPELHGDMPAYSQLTRFRPSMPLPEGWLDNYLHHESKEEVAVDNKDDDQRRRLEAP